jgi:hypothetical protein
LKIEKNFSLSKPATPPKKINYFYFIYFYLFLFLFIFIFIYFLILFRVRADAAQRPCGQQRGVETREGRGGEGRGGEGDASVRTPMSVWMLGCVRADASASARTRLVLSHVTSKRTLQCVQVTDAPAAIVRSFVRKRPRDNHGASCTGTALMAAAAAHALSETTGTGPTSAL